MSHFTVAVLTKEDETLFDLLLPYQENPDRGSEYLKFEAMDVQAEYEKRDDKYSDLTIDEYVEQVMVDYEGYERHGEDVGYWYNPNAKWDWFTEGGRWNDMLLLKDGTRADSALIKDIDFEGMEKARYENSIESFEDYKNYPFNRIKENETAEEYANRTKAFSTYAFLSTEKGWNEPGEMGWFGCSYASNEDEEAFSLNYWDNFLKDADPEAELTIVDCHI